MPFLMSAAAAFGGPLDTPGLLATAAPSTPGMAFLGAEGWLAMQAVPPAPGREQGTAQPASQAPADAAPPPGAGGSLFPILVMVVPMLLLLFFTSRSQQKKQAAAIASLKKGDRVLTQGGLVGRLVEFTDRYAKIEIAPGVKVEVLKSGIAGADTPEAEAAVAKK